MKSVVPQVNEIEVVRAEEVLVKGLSIAECQVLHQRSDLKAQCYASKCKVPLIFTEKPLNEVED